VGPTCRRRFSSPTHSRSFSVSWARFASCRAVAPRVPFSLSAPWASPVSSAFFALAVDQRVRTRARRRVSRPRRPPMRPAPLFRALPVPRAHPSPHFVQLHPLSCSAHAASRCRRPAPTFPTIQLTGDRSKPPRAPPRGETPVPVPNFPYCAMCSSNFAFAGARPRWSAALTQWPADLARSSSPVLIPKVHLPLLKPAQALACLKSPPRCRNGSPEFLWSARDLLTAVLLSLPMASRPLPRH
jgi:hypothetical protein